MKRAEQLSKAVVGTLPSASGGPFAKDYPRLWEFITDGLWDDGEPRQTGSVMFLCDDGWLKAWLNDRESGLTCWVSSETWLGLLKACEKALSGGGEWRKAKAKPGKGK